MPACSAPLWCHHDLTQHRVRVGDGAQRRAAGVEQGSLALGATDTETWFKISIPAAKSGIAAGVVLGIGRAIGEAMAVMMVAGNSPNMPDSLFRSVTLLTTAIAKETKVTPAACSGRHCSASRWCCSCSSCLSTSC